MAKRLNVVKVDSAEVQGEGSFVVIRKFTFGELKAIRKTAKSIEGDEDVAIEVSTDLLAAHIVQWDWVDEFDAPLPQPKDGSEVIDQLTNEEINFLSQKMLGAVAKKNS